MDPLHRRRLLTTFAATLPVAAILALGLPHALMHGAVSEFGCWLLPSAQVMTHPTSGDCPMRVMETVYGAGPSPDELDAVYRAAELVPLMAGGEPLYIATKPLPAEARYAVPVIEVSRHRRLARISLAIIASALLLTIPLFLLWNSPARAAVPLTIFYGATAVILTAMLAGQHSAIITRAAVVSLILSPAALTHLALTFPRERQVLTEVPELARIPYFVALVLVPIGWVALERDRLLGPAFLALLLMLAGAAWTVLLISCALAIRESESATERARARLVFFGAMVVPIIPTLFAIPAAGGSVRLGVLYLWSAAATMPLPIALAVSRYNLFDLGWDIRHGIARVLYLSAAALIAALVLQLAAWTMDGRSLVHDAAPLYLVCFLAVAAIEPLRTRMPGLIEAVIAPRLRELREVRESLARALESPIEDDEIARQLGGAIREGLGAESVAVLLGCADEWRTAHVGGRAYDPLELRDEALEALGAESMVHLPAEPDVEAWAVLLKRARIDAIASIDCFGERFGVALVGRSGRRAPFTGVELEFLCAVAARAGTALRNARLTSGLVAAEREATTGRLAVGLAHDLGKDLGWIRRLSGRLPELAGDGKRLRRDATMIRDLSEGLTDAVRRFVEESKLNASPNGAEKSLGELVDDAVRRNERAHGPGRMTQTLDPSARALHLHEHLGRAIGNLLDNALHASPDESSVHLFATFDSGVLTIAIEDRGSGIPCDLREHVFDAGVSTRLDEGGAGVGLTVSREIVQRLGGSLALERARGGGTKAVIRIPAREAL